MLAFDAIVSAPQVGASLPATAAIAPAQSSMVPTGGTPGAALKGEATPLVRPSYLLDRPAGDAAPLSQPSPYGLSPMQIRHAYVFDQVTLPGTTTVADGSGQTIAIVDAYNDPSIRTDLHAFDQQFGLADLIGSAFTIVSQTGSTTNLPGVDPSGPGASGSWDLETSLDVELAHALAPGANILLVEANSPGAADLQTAEDFARHQAGVVVVSMSFGYGEISGETMTDSTFTTPSGHPGVTFVAATGDSGQPGFYPSFSPNVLAVGGTTLTVDSSGNYVSETGWSGSGGGVSTIESQPGYQNGVVTQFSGTKRTTPDVAFDANPTTGASVYDSYDYGTTNPWVKVGGTSLSTPAWAALIAIADQARSSVGLTSLDGATQTLPTLYAISANDFNDITTGNNGTDAGPGYDLVTGLGTPKAAPLVNDLVGPFQVAATSPAAGSSVSAPPTDYAITFSSPYAINGIVARKLTVNGITADSVGITNSTTLTFHYDASPVNTQGLQTISIASGVLMRDADGSPLTAFNATFRYDVLPIAIDATTPANNSIVAAPLTTLNVHFNEAYAASTISASNLTLSQGSVAGLTLVDSQTVQYALSGVASPGTLSITMAAGAVTDTFGNPGPAYSGSLFVNGPTTAFPTPMAQINPAGSLIYQSSSNGSILFAGNTVSYTLPVAAGQTLSLVVTPAPGLEPQISLTGPGVNISASSTAAGAPVILQTVPINAEGSYAFTVSELNGTTGNYTIMADLNAALSTSVNGGAANHALATAQSVDGSFVALSGTAQRAALVSRSSVLAGPNNFGYYAVAVTPQFDDISTSGGTSIAFFAPNANFPSQLGPTLPSGISFPFFGTTYNTIYVNPHGLITLARNGASGINTDLSASPNAATISPLWDSITVSGSSQSAGYYKLEPTATGNRLVVEWYHVSFVGGPQTGQVTFEAILNSDGTIFFNYLNFNSSFMRSGDAGPTVGIKNSNAAGADPLVVPMTAGSGPVVTTGGSLEIARNIVSSVNDYYAFTLGTAQPTTVAVAPQNSVVVHVTLLDSQGNALAAGSSPGAGANVNEAVSNFVAPTAGTYYALVTGAAGAAYSLVVTRDAAFGVGNNVSFATAQDITGAKGALGAIVPSATENWYSINLSANSELDLQSYLPGGSTSQFVDSLSPAIQLYSPSDVLLASGQGGRNQTLDEQISIAGTYRIRVLSANSTTGEYFLSALVSASPPQITGIFVSGGANWSSTFYAYLAAGGLGDAQLGYRLLGAAGQLLPLPWNDITTLSVVFGQDVTINIAAAGLALVGSPDLPSPAALSTAAFSYNSGTHTAQWTFANPLNVDKYLLDIPAAAVANTSGVRLDGEWTTGGSSFPSGDGSPGGDFFFRFNLLPGDVDQNGVVTGADGNAVRLGLLQDTTSAGYSPFLDVNADGAITGQDGAAVRVQLLQALPIDDPSPPGQGFVMQGSGVGGQGSGAASPTSIAKSAPNTSTSDPASRLPVVSTTTSASKFGRALLSVSSSLTRDLRPLTPEMLDLAIESLTAAEIPALKSSGMFDNLQSSAKNEWLATSRAGADAAVASANKQLATGVVTPLMTTAPEKPPSSMLRISRAAGGVRNGHLSELHDRILEEFELIAASGRHKSRR